MPKFVAPEVCLISSEYNVDESKEKNKYQYWDRAFIVTNEYGYNALRKQIASVFEKNNLEFAKYFIYTENVNYIISAEWNIFESFIRLSYQTGLQKQIISHIVYDMLMNVAYRKYFTTINFDCNVLKKMKFDYNQYDLLSDNDILLLSSDVIIKHVSPIIKLSSSTAILDIITPSIAYNSCISSSIEPGVIVVPFDVACNPKTLRKFKTIQCDLFNFNMNLNSQIKHPVFGMNSQLECKKFVFEITLENLIATLSFHASQPTPNEMDYLILIYLIYTLIKDKYGYLLNDELTDIESSLSKFSHDISDALVVWDNI